MAEKDQSITHECTITAITDTAADTKRGQTYALIAVLGVFATTAWLGYLGQNVAAGIIGGTPFPALIWAFVRGRKSGVGQSVTVPEPVSPAPQGPSSDENPGESGSSAQ